MSASTRGIVAGQNWTERWENRLATRSARTSKKVEALKSEAPVSGPALWSPVNLRVRDRERKRDAVIQAAARAFRARGYHNTSLDDIASDLNVTKPTVYHYVQNKEQLLFECFRAGLQQIMQAFDEVAESREKARDRLAIVMTRYAEAIASDFGWCMVQAENQDLSTTMSRKVKALKSEIDQGLRRLITEGAKDGSLRPCDAKMAAFAIAGAFNWIAHWYRSDEALTATEIAEQFIDLFVEGLRPR
jgi:AcrR family transcriptional regulator